MASAPDGLPPPPGFMLFQKKVWFQTCAALLKTPVFSASLRSDVDDGLQRQSVEARAGDQLVQVVHIGFVMLAVMEADGLGRVDRLESVSEYGRGGSS